MKNLIILPIILLTMVQIYCQKKFDVKSDENILEIFSIQEIKDLNSIVEYVDNRVLSVSNKESLDEAYHDYFGKMSGLFEKDSVFPVHFDEIEKHKFFGNLNKSTFDAIFRMTTYREKVRYKDTILTNPDNMKILKFNSTGRYMEYLEKVGQSDKKFKEIHKIIEISGDIPMTVNMWVSDNHEDFDFEIIKNRLWAAISMLRFEGRSDDKIKRFLNK